VESDTDGSYVCTKSGDSVVPSLQNDKDGPVLKFTGLKANTITVIRIDVKIGYDYQIPCHCVQSANGEWKRECPPPPSIGYVRKTYISSAQKRDIQESQKHEDVYDCGFDRDIYSLFLFFNDFTVDGDYYKILLVSVDLTSDVNVLVCKDYTGCFTGSVPGKTGGTYKDRDCVWTPVSCDDRDRCTVDQCIPQYVLEDSNFPSAKCIHLPSCDSEVISGYCYYINDYPENWDCSKKCKKK